MEQNVSHPYDVPAEPEVTLIAPAPAMDFAPPGTPGEQWAITATPVSSEQQDDNNLDKIYKASSEDLAKKQRSRSWFHPVFPKKD